MIAAEQDSVAATIGPFDAALYAAEVAFLWHRANEMATRAPTPELWSLVSAASDLLNKATIAAYAPMRPIEEGEVA